MQNWVRRRSQFTAPVICPPLASVVGWPLVGGLPFELQPWWPEKELWEQAFGAVNTELI